MHKRYTPQHRVIALEQYPDALDVSSSCMHKANSHMASPGCFLFLYRRDSVCRPRLRDWQPPTEGHQRRPPTAPKGNWLGLHRDTAAKRNFAASCVHKELDTVGNGLMLPSEATAKPLAYGRNWGKKNSRMLIFSCLHMKFSAFSMIWFGLTGFTSGLFAYSKFKWVLCMK